MVPAATTSPYPGLQGNHRQYTMSITASANFCLHKEAADWLWPTGSGSLLPPGLYPLAALEGLAYSLLCSVLSGILLQRKAPRWHGCQSPVITSSPPNLGLRKRSQIRDLYRQNSRVCRSGNFPCLEK